MIKFSATNALVHTVTPVIEIASKNGGQPFCKRELIIDDSWEKDGQRHNNFVSIEFTGDMMSQLDSVFPGQRVDISGSLVGREYNGRIYNSVRGRSVTPHQAQQQYSAAPAPMPGYPQQPQQAQQYAPGRQTYGGQASSPGMSELPFTPR